MTEAKGIDNCRDRDGSVRQNLTADDADGHGFAVIGKAKLTPGGAEIAPQANPAFTFSEYQMHMLDYFRVPFPSRQGFSAYRFPGLAAHIPFFLIFSLSGFLLCGASPLLVVWMVAGLYLGRDVAVISHYALVLLPAIWLAMFLLLTQAKHVELFGRRHPAAGIVMTVLVLLVQVGAAGIAVIARDRRDRP